MSVTDPSEEGSRTRGARADRSVPKCHHRALKTPGSLMGTVFAGITKHGTFIPGGGERWRFSLYSQNLNFCTSTLILP